MKGHQKNTVKMIRAVSHYLNTNKAIIEPSIPIMTTKALFDQKFTELIDHFVVQYQDNKGYAMDKKQKRKTVEEKANSLSIALCAYASINGNFTLLKESHFTVTTLKTVSAPNLTEIARYLINIIEQYLPHLQPYGVDLYKVIEFKKSIDIFTESINKPMENIAIRHTSTIAIANLLSEINYLLKNNLDYNIRVLKDDFPNFVKAYFSVRHIGKTPRKSLDLVVQTICSSSQMPIEKAKVQIIGMNTSRFSGKKGRNIFMNLNQGYYRLSVTHINYEPAIIDFTIIANKTTTLNIVLEQKNNLDNPL
jgi:hypothetical protein